MRNTNPVRAFLRLVLCLFAWFASARASAQDTNPVEPKHVAEFARVLELGPDEKRALQSLYEAYSANLLVLEKQSKHVNAEKSKEYERKIDEHIAANEPAQAREVALRYMRLSLETEKPILDLNDSFLADVATLARTETQTARLERARRRHTAYWASHVNSVDLVDIAYHTDGLPAPDEACAAFLEKHQEELDAILSELNRVQTHGYDLAMQGVNLGPSGKILDTRECPLAYKQYMKDQRRVNLRLGNFAYRAMKEYAGIASPQAVTAMRERLPQTLVMYTLKSPSVEKLCKEALGNPTLGNDIHELVLQERDRYRKIEDQHFDAWVKLLERQFVTEREVIDGDIADDRVMLPIVAAREERLRAIEELRNGCAERIRRWASGR